jgi:hypothetical protein
MIVKTPAQQHEIVLRTDIVGLALAVVKKSNPALNILNKIKWP